MTSSEQSLHRQRQLASLAATLISLACGTNYVYSAWGPALAEHLKLTATEQNLVGASGNLGMYAVGIPIGMLVDHKGPRPGSLMGAFLVGLGYFGLHRAYVAGEEGFALPFLCVFMFMTGVGGACAFAGSVKTSALNWPEHRGTATAFPLSAFGLSAFFFATISSWATPGDPAAFLLVLSLGTFCLIFIPQFFLKIIPHTIRYKKLSENDDTPSWSTPGTSSQHSLGIMKRTAESDAGMETPTFENHVDHISHDIENGSHERHSEASGGYHADDGQTDQSPGIPIQLNEDDDHDNETETRKGHDQDTRGFALLRRVEFFEQFILMGLLTGVGLMTINNIGNDAQALWKKYDETVSTDWIRHRQATHVAIISVCSFIGRLLSGIGSDFIVKRLRRSRIWCLFLSSSLFGAAQLIGINLEAPQFLLFLSGLTGLAYGFLFGCFPSILAETFGVHGLSQNWGCMTLAPVVFANIFNLMYGRIYDSNSVIRDDGSRICHEGRLCYKNAYWVTFAASMAALSIASIAIRNQHVKHSAKRLAID